MSLRTAQFLASMFRELNLPVNPHFRGAAVASTVEDGPVELRGGMRLTVLSPTPRELQRLSRHWANESRKYASEDAPLAQDEVPVSRQRGGILLLHSTFDAKWAVRFKSHDAFSEISEDSAVMQLDALSDYAGSGMTDFRESIRQFDRVLLLVSRKALASKIFQQVMTQVTRKGLSVDLFWVLLEPCEWQKTLVARYQAAHNVSRPLDSLTSRECDETIGRILHGAQKAGPDLVSKMARSAEAGIPDVEALSARRFKEDASVPNASSIAFLAEYQDKSLLVGGDAIDSVLCNSIRMLLERRGQRRLRVDGFVVPHSASARNLGPELLQLLDCERYLISTNGAIYKLPDRETIARILVHGRASEDRVITLVFNYRTEFTQIWDDAKLKQRYRYETVFPSSPTGGIRMSL
jgi:hypothetical protein